jgi:hypothetical protein
MQRKDRVQRTPPGPAHRADGTRLTQRQLRQSSPGSGPAGLDASLPLDVEVPDRFGDVIDDRIAEILDELLEERKSARQQQPGRYIGAISLILAALAASVILRHSPVAWAIWPSAAAIGIATAWTARAGRS